MRGCFFIILVLLVLFGIGNFILSLDFESYLPEPLINEDLYYQYLDKDDPSVGEISTILRSGNPSEKSDELDQLIKSLGGEQCLLLLVDEFMDKPHIIEDLEPGLAINLTSDQFLYVTETLLNSNLLEDPTRLLNLYLKYMPAIDNSAGLEKAISLSKNDFNIRGLLNSTLPTISHNYLINQNVFYEDSTLIEDQVALISPGVFAELMISMSRDEKSYKGLMKYFPLTIMGVDNSSYGSDVMLVWYKHLDLSSERWKWDLFDEMVQLGEPDQIVGFLEKTDYVSYSLGGFLIHQHPEQLTSIPKRIRSSMANKLEEGILLPFEWMAVDHLRGGDIDYEDLRASDPITYYTLEIEQDPTNADNYAERAEAKVSWNEDHLGAIEDLTMALQLDPYNSDLFFKRANSRYYIGDIESSILDYDSVIIYNPENSTAWSNRGLMKKNLDRFEEAIADFNVAIELDQESMSNYYNRAMCHANLGNYTNTVEDLTTALVLDPENEDLLINRAYYLAELDEFQLSINDYDQLLIYDVNNAEAMSGKAYAYYRLEEYDSAIKYYGDASYYNSNDATLQYNIGYMYGAKGEYDNCIEAYNRAITMRPDYTDAIVNKAWAFQRLNNRDSACVNYRLAAELGHEGLESDIESMCY